MTLRLPRIPNRRLAATIVAIGMLTFSALALAVKLAPGSFRVAPDSRGAFSHIMVQASFAQPAQAELKGYNVFLARGFRFDPRAVAGRCAVAQARQGSCPADSQIGGGIGQVTVEGPSLPARQFNLTTTFYL